MYPRTHRTSLTDTPSRKKWKEESKMLALAYPLATALLRDEHIRLDNIKIDLIKRNHQLGNENLGYIHAGKTWSLFTPSALRQLGVTLKPIHLQLKPDAEELHQLYLKINDDWAKIHQSLTVVLGCCETRQEVRDVLPDNLSNLVAGVNKLPRTNEPGYLIQNNPILYKQYQKAIDVAYYYTANKLIF